MGKSKRNKKKNKPVKEPSKIQALPCIAQLAAVDAGDRVWAATSISNLAQFPENLDSIMGAGAISALIQTLNDIEPRVVLEVLGALRNILGEVGHVAVLEFLNLNGLARLLEMLPKISIKAMDQLVGVSNEDSESVDFRMLLEQLLACLWCVGEVSDEAIHLMSTGDMLSLLVSVFGNEQSPIGLRRVCGQFLNMISDDNPTIITLFSNNSEMLNAVVNIVLNEKLCTWQNCLIEIPLLACFVLENIKIVFDKQIDELYKRIFDIVSTVLNLDFAADYDKINEAGNAAEKIASNPEQFKNSEGKIDLNNVLAISNPETEYLAQVNTQLSTIQLALELITNIYSVENKAEDEDWEDEEMGEDEQIDEINSENLDTQTFNPMLIEMLFGGGDNLFAKISRLSLVKDYKFDSGTCNIVTANIRAVKVRALAALSNIYLLGLVDSFLKSDQPSLEQIWNSLTESLALNIQQDPIPTELCESLIICLWTISQRLLQCKVSINHNSSYIQLLIDILPQQTEPIKCKIIGVLAYFGQFQGRIQSNLLIGNCIFDNLAMALANNNLELCSEILNAIFDIYGDKNYDYDAAVFVQQGYLQKLEMFLPQFKSAMRNIVSTDAQLHGRCNEARINLSAFIKYKMNE